MFQLPGFERPNYSLEQYLLVLAKDIAELVVDPAKMGRFREQLKTYAKLWKEWKTAEEADQKGCWTPQMGRPEYIFNIFSRSYNPLKEPQKEDKRLAGSYALCAFVHDSQLSHLEKINENIVSEEAIEETLSAPDNMLEGGIADGRNASVYVIEMFFNYVKVDLQEFCKSEENKSKLKSIEQEIQQANKLSDIEFLELTAKKFEEREIKVLSKDETWHDLDRSLKGWFESAIGRLEKLGFKDKAGLLKYFYKNLLHFAEGTSIRSFRCFPDPSIVASARKSTSELAEKFKDLAQGAKISLEDAKAEIPVLSKENESGTIVELLKKDYLLKNEDNLKQELAKVAQDFVSRGLYNSTVCTGKQLQVHFNHLENLFNYIIESLKKDFADIPLSNFKEKLFTIVDEEYKKLIPLAYSHLVQAGLAQKNILKCIEQQVNKKRDKTKQSIVTKFAIFEKQKAVSKEKIRPEGTVKESSPPKHSRMVIWFKEYLNKNYIRATIKHLPYFGPYLYDLIYGVNGANISKKEGETTTVISEKREERPIDRKSLNDAHTIPKKENKPLYRKAWAIITAIIIILGGTWTVIQIYESDTFKKKFIRLQGYININEPKVQVSFKLTDSNEIAIVGSGLKGSGNFTLDLLHRNTGKKTANDATLKIIYPTKMSIKGTNKQLKSYSIGSGDTLRYITEVDIGKIRPDPTGSPIESEPIISLTNIKVDITDFTSIAPPFSFKIYTNPLTSFEIEAQIIADDYTSELQTLYIKTGTLEAFKNYKGRLFEVKGGKLVEYKK
jgi:hypothetical protein